MIKICIQDFVYHKQEISLPVGEWRIPNVVCRVVISRFVGFFFPKLLLIGGAKGVCADKALQALLHTFCKVTPVAWILLQVTWQGRAVCRAAVRLQELG